MARTHPDQPYGHVPSAFANSMGASSGWAHEPDETFLLARQQAAVDVAAWLDRNPYRGREMVDQWRNDLVIAGAIDSERGGLPA